jgi:hypothetical protein
MFEMVAPTGQILLIPVMRLLQRGDLPLKVGLKPWWAPGLLHFPKVLYLAKLLCNMVSDRIISATEGKRVDCGICR